MAPKRPPPVEDPPASSSDDEEVNSFEDVDDGADSSSSEEEKHHPEPAKPSSAPPPPPQSAKTITPQTASASESQTESDSDSDSDVDRSNVKPIASKPMSDAEPAKRLKTTSSTTPSKSASTTSKKVSETDSKFKQSKNKEKEVSAITNDNSGDPSMKKPLFQRIWSEEDEISILQGMLAFSLKKRNPINDVDDFLEYIKKSLHIDATRSQLLDKMKRLKKKYENNLKKFKEGEQVSFSKPHEQKAYQISKNIWSGEGTSGAIWESPMKPNGTARKANKGSKSTAEVKSDLISIPPAKRKNEKEKEKEKEKNTVADLNGNMERITGKRKSICASGIEEYVLNEGLDLVDASKKAELEKKWKTLQRMELEVFARRMELMSEQAKLVLAANKTANS